MNKIYTDEQISYIRDQALIYQCACPAQVCEAIDSIRQLYTHQNKCLDTTETDTAVHLRIKETTKINHEELERCLTDILRLEDWDMQTLKMPDTLMKRLRQNIK